MCHENISGVVFSACGRGSRGCQCLERGRERVRHEGRHTALAGGRGRAAKRVVAGASIEAGVAMRESVLGKTTRCAEDEGEAAGYLSRAKPKEAAHRDVDYHYNLFS
jgi:hypothetical protein